MSLMNSKSNQAQKICRHFSNQFSHFEIALCDLMFHEDINVGVNLLYSKEQFVCLSLVHFFLRRHLRHRRTPRSSLHPRPRPATLPHQIRPHRRALPRRRHDGHAGSPLRGEIPGGDGPVLRCRKYRRRGRVDRGGRDRQIRARWPCASIAFVRYLKLVQPQ